MNTNINRPTLAFYHPNPKGTGAAIRFEVVPATDSREGCLAVTLYGQKTGAEYVYPTFNTEEPIELRLDYTECSELLMILRGVDSNIPLAAAKCHQNAKISALFSFKYHDAFDAFRFDAKCRSNNDEFEERSVCCALSKAEAIGLEAALTGCMHLIAFGL